MIQGQMLVSGIVTYKAWFGTFLLADLAPSPDKQGQAPEEQAFLEAGSSSESFHETLESRSAFFTAAGQ